MQTSEFIKKSIDLHGNFYDYSKVRYVNARTKVDIICKIHGMFSQLPRKHLAGQRCHKCSIDAIASKSRLSVDDFIRKASAVHSGKYDYSNVNYKSANSKVVIICPIHGDFEQRAISHLRGLGCDKCRLSTGGRLLSVEEFTSRARAKFGDKFDYSKISDFPGMIGGEIEISCPIHGGFVTRPINHLSSVNGCPRCSLSKTKLSSFDAIDRLVGLYGDKFDYSSTVYTGIQNKITIICKKHGEFSQLYSSHYRCGNCPKCLLESWSESNRSDLNKFITDANRIHKNKYEYSNVVYINNKTKVVINCLQHGRFHQTPKHHLRGQGCPRCGLSSLQSDVANYVMSIYSGRVLLNDKSLGVEIDVFLPEIGFGIETDGLFWHSYHKLETSDQINRHVNKNDIALHSGISLFQIREDEWRDKRKILESMISNKLRLGNKIYARQCSIVMVDKKSAHDFFECNHIAGDRNASYNLGLVYKGDLVFCMSFSKHQKYSFELIRMATVGGCVVVGGASKILSKFVKMFKPRSVLSYADRRFSHGHTYTALGFELVAKTKPNYRYVKGDKTFSRQMFQKHKLLKRLKLFDPNESESANMFANGYRRIWDAGHLKFVKSF